MIEKQIKGIFFIVLLSLSVSKDVLHVDEDGKFKIAQFTDLHFGEAENLDWGPRADRNSLKVMAKIIEYEQPSLVAFTGDQMTGNNIKTNATDIWDYMMTSVIRADQKYAVVMGNHDDIPWEEDCIQGKDEQKKCVIPWERRGKSHPLKSVTSRATLYAHDMGYPNSYTQMMYRSSQCKGGNDYYLLVYSYDRSRVLMVLWFLDSGGGTIQENICKDSIDWLITTSAALKALYGDSIQQMAFMHIPLWQYVGLYESLNDKGMCWGMNENGGVTPTETDTGLYQAFQEMGVQWTVVGHNHGNDWCCKDTNQQMLCFGRHTGYGGYGTWHRGSRLYQYNSLTQTIASWVRMEDGRIIHETP